MPISPVTKEHFMVLDGSSNDYPQLQLEEELKNCFKDKGTAAGVFEAIKGKYLSNPSNETQWVVDMNTIITLWNQLPTNRSEKTIRQAFGV